MTHTGPDLCWLPERPDWSQLFDLARTLPPMEAMNALTDLANCRIDFLQTTRLDRAAPETVHRLMAVEGSEPPLRLAILGSCTLTHLVPGIRVGALRRRMRVEVYEAPYGAYRQEVLDSSSRLHAFHPEVLLLSLDTRHLLGAADKGADTLSELRECWRAAHRAFECAIIQQTALPLRTPLAGNNEHRYAVSPCWRTTELNFRLRELADAEGVHLLAIDEFAARDGFIYWHDESLWHRAKQEIHPRVGHMYGDQVARLLAALRGRSRKCLVLDLDNVLWGGVVGDAGLSGIDIGQGNALAEAHLAFQRYVKDLSARGIILAVCSKNDEAVALEVFDRHPEMLLRRADIACFVANWQDKATNLRAIAERLNIGTDSIVFVDDSPFERQLIRRELPEVAVPELPEDPALYADCLASAGYFEAVSLTREDQLRTQLYQANAERERLRATTTDLPAYLASLEMRLHFSPFRDIDVPRIVQLINKTNQFNLTTRRFSAVEIQELLMKPDAVHLQFRLLDRFGDNGIIALVIGDLLSDRALSLHTWLMSCRVLGRGVEAATLNVLSRIAARRRATALLGHYRPTAKNSMVKEHYRTLGFSLVSDDVDTGETRWVLGLQNFCEQPVFMSMEEYP